MIDIFKNLEKTFISLEKRIEEIGDKKGDSFNEEDVYIMNEMTHHVSEITTNFRTYFDKLNNKQDAKETNTSKDT